jgi:6-pyruvoyltetrahydropterin/6-carboxytetrahydropterin synthase
MEVTLAGNVNQVSGYVMDLKKLNVILMDKIINKVDHKFLNEVGMFRNIIPTTENMVKVFWDELKDLLLGDNYKLYSIKLYETEKNFVIYKGDE